MSLKKEVKIKANFTKIRIGLASPENILTRSFGEVTKPETINYRSFKPEMGGLFCERIFGPIKDYECHCGKYKRIRYKGIVCDRCGVEVTEKKVRRERMGHINLVVPVAHIWYFRSLPNKIGYLLGIPSKKLDMVVYYERYLVCQPGIKTNDGVQTLDMLTEEEYLDILDTLPKDNQHLDDADPNKFIAKMGGEALWFMLSKIDLDTLSFDLRIKANTETSQQRKNEALKRLKVIEGFRNSQRHGENRPEWMVVKILPVIPPELRPLVPLEGGRFATSDLNDLYRRVIIRNNRLKRLMEIKAPEVILRNEKRMLQEAVDSLFDNTRRVSAVKTEGNRPLKSLSDMLKGKQGRFRQNLLGKRVDYSGRSVIVVGPNLKLHECGIPKNMAAELFKPFVIRKLLERGIVKTVKSAKKLVDRKEAIIWDILENILKGHPILLNRAPTLHRLGIQAFQPKLVEGKAIQLHPLVCTGFNADFDGDQMAVHVPLGNAAVLEAQLLMLAPHNILNPANGAPITVPSQDMVLGLYYITKGRKHTEEFPIKGEGLRFYSSEEAIIAYNEGKVHLHAWVKVRANVKENGELVSRVIDTTMGRILFNQVVPATHGYINELLTKKSLRDIIGNMFKEVGQDHCAHFLDDIKYLGFQYAFRGGLSFNLSYVNIPDEKEVFIKQAQAEVDEIWDNYNNGFITNNERYNQVIDIWTRINSRLADTLLKQLKEDQQGFNPVYMMLDSGARGSKEQIRQLGGMRGLMAKPQKNLSGGTGEIIENPILSNFKEGLSVIEYFISTHGARKGLADTALKTADAGYLTRRLHDVAQDVVVNSFDCGTLRGIPISSLKDNEEVVETLYERILGRTSVHDIYDPLSGELICNAGDEINEEIAQKIEDSPIETLEIRSVLTCETRYGVCCKCYGRSMSTGRDARIGDAVGVIAAQSIGEPGTQLTLRTFHVGGTASNIASESQMVAKFAGILEFEEIRTTDLKNEEGAIDTVIVGRQGEIRILDEKTRNPIITINIPYGAHLKVKNGEVVEKGTLICTWDPYNAVIISEFSGKVSFENIIENVNYKEESDEQTGHKEKVIVESRDKTKIPSIIVSEGKDKASKEYNLPVGAHIIIENGHKIKAGEILVKIPRIVGKTRDITGGLPRVTELFEARNPSNPAIVTEIDGVVTFGGIKRGNREIMITSKDSEQKKYLVPLSKHILVQENDFVKAGSSLSDGSISPQDILRIEGPLAVQRYIVNGIMEVYRLQGVKINDKHVEVIIRQMMKHVEVGDPGDTTFLEGEFVTRWDLKQANDWIYDKKVVLEAGDSTTVKPGQIISVRKLRDENSQLKRKDMKLVEVRDAQSATVTQIIMGITKASLGTHSFMSAASFQETTKVLNEAAISGKVDRMLGLKENVIVGHLIPAGTGIRDYEKLVVGSKEEYDLLMASKED
ncbi:MAG: DNA-directed RNA polymerase subunit beta' [Bacteroidia bacterium]|nr:DNA-directed RNA polymerase subunit beta' [Bacteroidia bacterium]MCF8425238.1 DNA-directed RNA polymerase subunit beta' [Bacteroidia bacterium]MCF8446438.1 DNA-directed RNA polymerase subunit beta' [Bacteroidia bacterium]